MKIKLNDKHLGVFLLLLRFHFGFSYYTLFSATVVVIIDIVLSAVAAAIRTSLGPRGMDKMIQASNGEVTITNDGATILKQMNVIHPAAKMVDIALFMFYFNPFVFFAHELINILSYCSSKAKTLALGCKRGQTSKCSLSLWILYNSFIILEMEQTENEQMEQTLLFLLNSVLYYKNLYRLSKICIAVG